MAALVDESYAGCRASVGILYEDPDDWHEWEASEAHSLLEKRVAGDPSPLAWAEARSHAEPWGVQSSYAAVSARADNIDERTQNRYYTYMEASMESSLYEYFRIQSDVLAPGTSVQVRGIGNARGTFEVYDDSAANPPQYEYVYASLEVSATVYRGSDTVGDIINANAVVGRTGHGDAGDWAGLLQYSEDGTGHKSGVLNAVTERMLTLQVGETYYLRVWQWLEASSDDVAGSSAMAQFEPTQFISLEATSSDFTVARVPEPAGALLLVTAAIALLRRRARE
jgi:hypothetical protein